MEHLNPGGSLKDRPVFAHAAPARWRTAGFRARKVIWTAHRAIQASLRDDRSGPRLPVEIVIPNNASSSGEATARARRPAHLTDALRVTTKLCARFTGVITLTPSAISSATNTAMTIKLAGALRDDRSGDFRANPR